MARGRGVTPAPAAASAAPELESIAAGLPPRLFDPAGMLAIGDMLPVMVAFVDRDLRYLYLNRPLADWLEKPRSEILGRTLREVLGEKAFAVRSPILAEALKGERKFFASEFDHPSRGSLAVQTDYVPWVEEGETRGIIILIQDVTEQRSAERALRESEARFRRIANQAPVLMWVTRLDRTRDFVNEAYCEFTGLAEDEARTLDWRTRIHPDDLERIIAESLAGEATMQPFALEGRYRRGDGEYRWLKSVSAPRFGPDGEHVGFIGAATDITLAKQAELKLKALVRERTKQLAESEAQFRSIFDAVLEVLVLMDTDGTILQLNRKREVWRHPRGHESIGKKIWEAPTLLAYPQHIPLIKQAVEVAARGELFTAEVKMEREGVPTAFLDVVVQPVRDDEGKIIYLLFEARDVTDLKATQEQLRQAQKMEALGQLTGGIAHDFNNLLTVVVGGLDLISKRVEDEKLKRYTSNALAAAERGARLTGQLLAFSRVQRLEVRPVHLAPLIENMQALMRNVLGPGIEKRFDIAPDLPPVMADPTQVEVAMLNLAINARDAMPGGGVLKFSARRLAVTADGELPDGDYVELAITDTGIGMTEQVAARAFEPFFTTKEVGKGTGLGLSMVYGMARQSGGTARIESEQGVGTTVRLLFRTADGGEAVTASAEAEAAGDKRKPRRASVLVIDDDPDVRGFIASTLSEQGYTVREASDGAEGLAALAKEPPDLVVLDYVMPGMSGAEVASKVLAERPDQPILFVSGYSETDSIRKIAPNAPLLSKPFRASALEKAVQAALDKG
ncbi:MAG TPA: PAS domain S-box protein [Sphingomicrobium sp.]|nr:PAS domain S-box protein [Sphingomicrobium sp.]